jgi:hypothetical protein
MCKADAPSVLKPASTNCRSFCLLVTKPYDLLHGIALDPGQAFCRYRIMSLLMHSFVIFEGLWSCGNLKVQRRRNPRVPGVHAVLTTTGKVCAERGAVSPHEQ